MDTLMYIEEELQKYAGKVFGRSLDVRFEIEDGLDDGYSIQMTCGKGTVRANNKRSALMAVYKIFELMGCRFIRPTAKGERIVKRDVSECNIDYQFLPSYRHRGITIEGAVSREQLIDLLEWMPKVGMNSYFMQFRTGYEFFERWYLHKSSTVLSEEAFSAEMVKRINRDVEAEIKKRDLIYHKVGHGWTCEALNISSNGWHKTDVCDEKIKPFLAQIDGERTFYQKTPLNTHLCYSKPEVQEMLVREVTEYAANNPQVDYLHFWLADAYNNFCECEECRKKMPADFYIEICNRIDRRLTELGLSTKIVFLVYLELYWKPQISRFINKDRFTLMFAPIFRSYSHPLLPEGKESRFGIPEFKLNNNSYLRDTDSYLSFLKSWQDIFEGDSFDFDYHLMWDINRDLSSLNLAKILHKDIVDLRNIGLNGYISCQVQRAFMPLALNMYVLSKTLCDRNLTYEQLEKSYFGDTYGENCDLVKEIFQFISENVDYQYLRDEKDAADQDCLCRFQKAITGLNGYLRQLESIETERLDCFETESMDEVVFWVKLLLKLLPCYVLKTQGADKELIREEFAVCNDYLSENELRFQNLIDCHYFRFINEEFLVADNG